MNFLAHFYLSGSSDEMKIGNFIGDFVKGRDYLKYPTDIRQGIILHRKIDTYTDAHPVVRESKSIFYPTYHKYSGILTDIIFDHYLTVHWDEYCNLPFIEYVDGIYVLLKKNMYLLPIEVSTFVSRFVEKRWLDIYCTLDGIERVFEGMVKNTSLPDKTSMAMEVIKINYSYLDEIFKEFFPQLIHYVTAIKDK